MLISSSGASWAGDCWKHLEMIDLLFLFQRIGAQRFNSVLLQDGFYRAMHFSAKRGIAIACRLSVCLSVTLVNCDHIRLEFFENNFTIS